MREEIKQALTLLISAIQAAKIYTTEHPKFIEFIDSAYGNLRNVLKDKPELIIGLVEGELAFEHEIFFDLSQKLRPLINYLQEREIEKIIFYPGLKREELAEFISLITTSKQGLSKDPKDILFRLGIRNISISKLKAPTPEFKKKVKKIKKYLLEYEGTLEKVSNYLEAVINEEDLDYLELKFDVLSFLEDLVEMYYEFLDLTTFRRKDLITFVHLLNVTILSMFVSSRMGYSKDDVIDIGISSLFHDIGKIYVRKIVQKKGKLDDEEFALLKHHTILGTELLFRYKDTLGPLPAIVAFEHHLRYDLKGYPKVSFPQKLHPASRIVSVCDVYDALFQRRSYKKSFPPLKIYDIMKNERGKMFDPQIFDEFFRIMGIWPIKSIVALNDRRIAVVREQNEKDIFRPKLEIIHPKKKKGFVDLLKEKKTEIKEYLDPSDKGKKFLPLISSEG
jgi:HD-GYP domain-containing protein (c-di-GMP phosphodiesterase class II)